MISLHFSQISFPGALKIAPMLALGFAPIGQAAVVVAQRSTDNVLQGNFEAGGPSVFLQNNSNARRAGAGGAGGAQRVNNPVLGFTLPAIPAGETITAASLGLTMDATAITGAPIGFDMVISLMTQEVVGDFSGVDFTEDSGSLGAGIFVATVTAADVANNSLETFSLSGEALSQIAGLYDLSGTPSQTEVFFRLSTSASIDTTDPANDNDRFNFARNDDGDGNLVTRSLVFTTTPVPEPSALMMLCLSALGVFARRR